VYIVYVHDHVQNTSLTEFVFQPGFKSDGFNFKSVQAMHKAVLKASYSDEVHEASVRPGQFTIEHIVHIQHSDSVCGEQMWMLTDQSTTGGF
jgi:hypothetical protein